MKTGNFDNTKRGFDKEDNGEEKCFQPRLPYKMKKNIAQPQRRVRRRLPYNLFSIVENLYCFSNGLSLGLA